MQLHTLQKPSAKLFHPCFLAYLQVARHQLLGAVRWRQLGLRLKKLRRPVLPKALQKLKLKTLHCKLAFKPPKKKH